MPHNSRATGHPQIPKQYSFNLFINEDEEESREKKNVSTIHRDKPGYQLHLWTIGYLNHAGRYLKLVLWKYGTDYSRRSTTNNQISRDFCQLTRSLHVKVPLPAFFLCFPCCLSFSGFLKGKIRKLYSEQ